VDIFGIVKAYVAPLFLLGLFFVSMYTDIERIDRCLSEEMRNKLILKENSIFRKLLPNRPEKVWDFTKAKYRTVKNKNAYLYHRVIPFFIYLIATIIIWILATINFFIVGFMTNQSYDNIYFTMFALAVFYEVAVMICLNNK